MTRLSVNINKIALLRNARGENMPNLLAVAQDCIAFGAQGITVHPRPDQRHITYQDVQDLKNNITVELNVEGYPNKAFLQLVHDVQPTQVTLVPDPPEALTSNAGWNLAKSHDFLVPIIKQLQHSGIRVSVFMHPADIQKQPLLDLACDCIELYTYDYAREFKNCKKSAILTYQKAVNILKDSAIRIHAGHDLNLNNLKYLLSQLPNISEVSIGHALICEALYEGLETTIKNYRAITS